MFLLLLFLELGLVVLLVVDSFEARESFIRGYAAFTLQNVDHYAVGPLLDSLPSEAGFFSETSLVAEVSLVTQVVDAVKELASLTVHAVTLVLVLTAELGLVVRWQVLLWHQLVGVVGVGARITILAVMVHDYVPAHLSLLHLLDFLVELEPLLLVDELLLLRLSSGLTSEARHLIEVVLVVEVRVGRVHLLQLDWLLPAV